MDFQLLVGIFPQVLLDGLILGFMYALIALGYTMVYGVLEFINFAHSEIFIVGAFVGVEVMLGLKSVGLLEGLPWPVVLILVLLAGMAGSGLLAVTVERVAYRPLRNAPRLVPLITAIGASLFLQYTFASFFGSESRGYPSISALEGTWTILGTPIAKTLVLTVVAAVLMLVGLTQFISRTKVGKAMRAVAEDKEIASLMGINVNRVIVTTFAIGGILAGVAGVMFALVFGLVQYNMGFVPGIKAFTAAVLGGIGSVTGAAIGGLILGVVESVGPVLLLSGIHVPAPNQLRDVIAFSILVLVLIFRPGGILGTGEPERG